MVVYAFINPGHTNVSRGSSNSPVGPAFVDAKGDVRVASDRSNNDSPTADALDSTEIPCSQKTPATLLEMPEIRTRTSSVARHHNNLGLSSSSQPSINQASPMRVSIVTTEVTTVQPGTATTFVTRTGRRMTPSMDVSIVTHTATATSPPTTAVLVSTHSGAAGIIPTSITSSSNSLSMHPWTTNTASTTGSSSHQRPSDVYPNPILLPRPSNQPHSSDAFTRSSSLQSGTGSYSIIQPVSTSTTPLPTSAIPSDQQQQDGVPVGQNHRPRTTVVVASTICGAFAIGLMGLLLFCCFRRRKKHRRRGSSSTASSNSHHKPREWPSWPSRLTGRTPTDEGRATPDMTSSSNTGLLISHQRSTSVGSAPPIPSRHPNRSNPNLFETAIATAAASPPRPPRPTKSTVQRTFDELFLPTSPVAHHHQQQQYISPSRPRLRLQTPSPVPGTAITAPFVVPVGRKSLLPSPLRSSNRFSDFRFSLSPNPVLRPPPMPPSKPSAAAVRALANQSLHLAVPTSGNYLTLPSPSPARTISRKSYASSYVSQATSRRVSIDSTGRRRKSDPFDLEAAWSPGSLYSTRGMQQQHYV